MIEAAALEALALCILMALAAYRIFRLLAVDDFPPIVWARDRVDDWIAERFGDEWADGLTCGWCLGAWCSFAVVGLTDAFTSVPLVGLQLGAVSTIVGILGSKVD